MLFAYLRLLLHHLFERKLERKESAHPAQCYEFGR